MVNIHTSKALRKQDVIALRNEQRSLVDLQDQKIDVLADNVHHLDDCFQIARTKRIELQELYERRRKEVRAEIEKIRVDIGNIFAAKHKRVRDFGTEWMATLQDAIKEWEDTLEDRSQEMEERLDDVRNEISGFHTDLDIEKKDRIQEIEEATQGLLTHLDRIREDLDRTRNERLVQETRYAEKFATNFEHLDQMVKQETEIRQEQWEVSVKQTKDAYKSMHEKEDVVERDISHFLESQQLNLDVEEGHRIVCQQDVLHGSIKFLDYLKDNIVDDVDNSKKRNNMRRGYIEVPNPAENFNAQGSG